MCERFYPVIYRYIAYRVNRKEDAEDLTSEVFLRAVRSLSTSQGSTQGLLYKIAENLLIDFYRRRKTRRNIIEASDTLDNLPDTQTSAPDQLHQVDLQHGLKQLTGNQYQVIIMRFIEGFSIKEIASTLHKSEGAVKALQFRALQTMRQFLNEEIRDV